MKLRSILNGPPNWIAHSLSQETRRTIAFWLLVVATILYFFIGSMVLFASALGVVGLAGIVTGETPNEEKS